MSEILNAAPMVIDLGTQDLSTRTIPLAPLSVPQHLPKLYVFAEKGPIGSNYVDFDEVSLTQLYGDDTFDVNLKYHTHQTPFLQATAAAANNCVVHRLVPSDAKDTANVCLYLDVLPTQVPIYEKSSDGSIRLDSNGNRIVRTDSNGDPITVAGYKVAWVTDKTVANIGEYQRGLLTQRPGLQADGAVQSVQYPIFEFSASSPGEGGNKLAVKMYPAFLTDLVPFPSIMLSDGKQYPYYFSMSKIVDTLTSKTNTVFNSFGSQFTRFTIKGNGVDPASGAVVDLKKVVEDQYIKLRPAQASGLGSVFTYQNNLDTVLTLFYNVEKNISDSNRDIIINNSELNVHAFNVMTFTSSNGSPYHTVQQVDVPGSVRLTKNTNIFLSGSSDGTITESVMDSLVLADLDNYNNSLHEYNDLVLHPESIIYDSGFSLNVKRAMAKFISRRKDTMIALATYAHNAPNISLESQYSVAIALKTMVELYPESSFFGTPVMRGIIMGGSGNLINSLYTKRVPLTYELLYKSARYMGAKNGKWRNGFCFDKAPLSIITQLKDIDVTWVPTSTRNTLWSVGLNFVLNYGVRRQFFPALQTVYENDTSILNSVFAAMAICYINKVEHAAWREFSGSISFTDAQLEEQVNNFIADLLKDKFDDKYITVPNCHVTELDALRGYSWTTAVTIYGNVAKTVSTVYTVARRMSDLEA